MSARVNMSICLSVQLKTLHFSKLVKSSTRFIIDEARKVSYKVLNVECDFKWYFTFLFSFKVKLSLY